MINWAPYFTSGENFGQAFNQDFNQAQNLKFQQARAIVDDEFTRQRLAQQQQSADQLGRYYDVLAQQGAGNLAVRQAEQALAEKKFKFDMENMGPDQPTEEEKQKYFMSLAGPQGAQMAIGPATDLMKATPGYEPTPQQIAAYLASASKVQAPNAPGIGADIAGGMAGAQGLPTSTLQAPPPDQAFLPATELAKNYKESLEAQHNARTQALQASAQKTLQSIQLAGDAATATNDLKASQKALADERAKQLAIQGPWNRFVQGENLKVKEAEVAISQMRTKIYGQQVDIQARNLAIKQAGQTRQFMNSELGRIQTEQRMLGTEQGKIKDALAAYKASMEGIEGTNPGGYQNDPNYIKAQANYNNLATRSMQITPRIKALNTRADQYRSLLGLLPDQSPINKAGTPLLPTGTPSPPPNAVELKANLQRRGGPLTPAQVNPPQAKVLDKATAQSILNEAGGDKNRARQIAKQRGYQF